MTVEVKKTVNTAKHAVVLNMSFFKGNRVVYHPRHFKHASYLLLLLGDLSFPRCPPPVAAAAASRAAVPLRGAPLPPLRLLTLPRPKTAEAPRGRGELLLLAIVARDGI